MTADDLAERLREAHPDADPQELDVMTLRDWFRNVGGDPDDDELLAATVVAWGFTIS